MKKVNRIVAFITAIILPVFQISAQNASPLGSKTVYSPAMPEIETTPSGYQLFFINYAGRHGARHLTNLKTLNLFKHFLMRANDADALTTQGRKLQTMIQHLSEIENKYAPGTLSMLGNKEQNEMGKRMRERCPESVLSADVCIQAVTTKEKRTVQSAESFIKGFLQDKTEDPFPRIRRIVNDSIRLRFFSLCPAYLHFEKNGSWKVKADQLKFSAASKRLNREMLNLFFIPAFADQIEHEEFEGIEGSSDFSSMFYALGSITAGLRMEIETAGYDTGDLDLFSLLTEEQLANLVLVDGAKDFLTKGPGENPDGIQVRDAMPALADFISTADHRIDHNINGAVLRFAHAETIAPLACLMQLEGAATADTDIFHYNQAWDISRIMSYSANIQWIFYRKSAAGKNGRNDSCLVKILFNEKPVHIPVAPFLFPYYRWKDVRAFYMNILNNHGVGLTDDMYQYLLRLQ